MSPFVWLAAAVLGGGGAILRFVVDGAVAARLGRDFPFGTFIVNISGAFVLGLATGLALHTDEETLAGTATIGSYTTFSTWMLESQRLFEDGEALNLFANISASLVVGVAAAALGRLIA